MPKRLVLFVVVLGSCSFAPAQPAAHELAWSAETVFATSRLLRPSTDSSLGGTGFLRPASIRANEHATVVADIGDDRILILDSVGNVTRSFGSRGRGPGELFGVSHLALRSSTILIGEANNGRVSEFTLSGTFMKTNTAGFAAGAIAANDRDVFTATRSADFYAALISPHAPPINALRRPTLDPAGDRDRWLRLPGHDLIAADSARTWVFDQATGNLCEYDAPDAQPNCVVLPAGILNRLRRYRNDRVELLEKAIRMQVEAAPLAKDLLIAGRRLALLLPLSDIPVLLIDLDDGTLTPVMTLGGQLPDWARSARSFAWDGRGFLLIGDDGLGRFDLSTFTPTSR